MGSSTNRRLIWNKKITHSKVFGAIHKIMVTHTVTGTMNLTLTGVAQMRVGIDLIHALENMERNYGESSNVLTYILSYKH